MFVSTVQMSSEQLELTSTLTSLANDFHREGILELFGIAGDPITPLITACEKLGMKYYGFRNEQAASYASSAVSYLTARSRLALTLSVAGPGFVNSLSGLGNATVNGWPMLLVCPLNMSNGDFQSIDQFDMLTPGICRGYVVYTDEGSVREAVNMAMTGGGVVLFIPIKPVPSHVALIKNFIPSVVVPKTSPLTSRPLLVIGGLAGMYSESHKALLAWVEKTKCPYIAEPMGRGVIPENHPLCVTAARSRAMSTCTSCVVVHGKLDWMLSHGKSPKWRDDCQFLDLGNVTGVDLSSVLNSIRCTVDSEWVTELTAVVNANKKSLSSRLLSGPHKSLPTHYEAIGAIRRAISLHNLNASSIIVSEGANTMDVARVALDDISQPRLRLDSGRWGTMGSGLGFVVAACAISDEIVIAIEGDSAFGFSGMELETIVRYKCRAIIVVFNNGGIYTGAGENATALSQIRHDLMMHAFGGVGLRTAGNNVEDVMNEAVSRVKMGYLI